MRGQSLLIGQQRRRRQQGIFTHQKRPATTNLFFLLAMLLSRRTSAYCVGPLRRALLQSQGRTAVTSSGNLFSLTAKTVPRVCSRLSASTLETTTANHTVATSSDTDDAQEEVFVAEHEHDNWNRPNGTDPSEEALDTVSNSTTASSSSTPASSELLLWDPEKDFNMTYPKSLSPSAINEFRQCPQSFLFQYIYGLRQPTSLALAKGSFCHEALEQIFDLDAKDRTLQNLQNLFRKAWSLKRQSDVYGKLFCHENGEWDLQAEAAWGREALQLLENYVHYEDPCKVARPNPIQRELWVQAHLALDPQQGKTGYVVSSKPKDEATAKKDNAETFHVRGIVDRLDMVREPSTCDIVMRLTDYKTGKAPELKYSPAMNDKIVQQNFFQLQIYALLLREKQFDMQHSVDLRFLRLLYLTSQKGPTVSWDYDMGATQEERDAVMQDVHAQLAQVWMDIVQLVSQQDARLWQGCDRSFCYCHKCRPKFHPGTVWEPPTDGVE